MRNQPGVKRMLLLLVVIALFVAVPATLAAEEGGGPLDALGINMGFLIAQLVNFGLIFAVLTIFLWRPLVNMLDARSARIEKGLEDAAAAANARMNAEAEAEKILAAARVEAAGVIDEARSRGEEVAKAVESEARGEAESIREQARQSAVEERNQQLADLRNQVVNIAVAVAERLIGDSLVDKKQQQAIIKDFLTKVPAEAKNLSGPVEIVSALPLEDAEQADIKKQLGVSDATFVVEPSILGGLIIRSEDRVIDGSVRRGMGEIRGRMS